ncbi:MAG: Ldh family oxidoreductase [Betaproteobacteria bacterium]|nr:Ldh family oxidoreductase [Betaproteobacteria bacterium]
MRNVPAELLRKQIQSVLTAWGMDSALVRTTADVMIETDLAGVESHGVSMLWEYDQWRRRGKVNLHARCKIVRENAVTALVDADAGLGHPAAVYGMQLAIEKARGLGVGVVSVFNSHHFGAAGYYARLAAEAGMIGLITSATRTIGVVPTRAKLPLLGTNPIAFAAPARRNRPFVLDMATSTVAANKVRIYDMKGKALPPGWVVDERGEAVRDAATGMDIVFRRAKDLGGGLAPLGGTADMASHKGYGLAMLAHILGGTLSGGSFSPIRVKTQKPGDPDNIGHFFMALDPQTFRSGGAFEDDLDSAIDVLHQTPPANPAEPVLVAGDPEATTRTERLANGIPIAAALATKIREVCEQSGVPFILA